MVERTGPRLTITGTCEGCAWLRPSTVGGARLGFVDCTHPARPVPFIGNVNTSITTPDDCPELPAARLALARSVVAGDRPERSYQGPMPFVEDEDAPRSRRPSDEEEPTR